MRGATDFSSTAAFYSRYRVPYPASLIARLRADAGIGPDSVALDLATGPGRLALALAPFVREVVALDAEPEMLDEGRRVAARRHIGNVKWVHARAEQLDIRSNSVDLVTVGEAIHRLDQTLVLERIMEWLRDDACVALAGCFGVLHGEHAWQRCLRHELSKWTNDRPIGRPRIPRGKVHDAQLLTDAGFADVVNREFIGSKTWTPASILGHLHSTSRFSLSVLGDQREDFENAVLGALDADESSQFPQEVSCGYTVGWKRRA